MLAWAAPALAPVPAWAAATAPDPGPVSGAKFARAEIGPAASAPLIVSAAASLTEFARALVALAAAERQPQTVRLNIAGSDTLVTQVLRGAPVDVLMLADEQAMQRAIDGGAVDPGEVRLFARNRLAIVSRGGLRTLAELAATGVGRVAIGNPATVPAGRYARAALQGERLWERVRPRLVYAQHVRQALAYAVRGEVDAAIVYATDVAIVAERALRMHTLAGSEALGIRYPLAPVRHGRLPQAAARFVALAQSEPARAQLHALGFLSP